MAFPYNFWIKLCLDWRRLMKSKKKVHVFLSAVRKGEGRGSFQTWKLNWRHSLCWDLIGFMQKNEQGMWKQWNGVVVLVEVVLEGCSKEGPLEIWGHLGRSFVIWRDSYKWYLWKRQDHGGCEDQPKCKVARMYWGNGRNGGKGHQVSENGGSWHHNKEFDFVLKNIGCHLEKGLTQWDSVTMICSWEQWWLDQGEKWRGDGEIESDPG